MKDTSLCSDLRGMTLINIPGKGNVLEKKNGNKEGSIQIGEQWTSSTLSVGYLRVNGIYQTSLNVLCGFGESVSLHTSVGFVIGEWGSGSYSV